MRAGGKAISKSRGREVEPAAPKWKLHVLLVGAVICAALCAYSNSFRAPFLLDNDPIILQDSRIRSVTSEHIQRIVTQQYWPNNITRLYRPLTTLSYLFNYAVLENAANPDGYHWLNFLLHAINIALVYWLGLVLFREPPAAFFMSAVWGLHPVLTESVTNVVGRADLVACFSVMAGLLFHRKAVRSSGSAKAAWIVALALAVAVGVFSKESAVVVFAVMAVNDLTFARREAWRSHVASYAAAAIPTAIFLGARAWVLANTAWAPFPFCDNPLIGAAFWTARATALKVIGKYLLLMAWPARLSVDYSYNQIPLFAWGANGMEDGKAVAALIACLAAAALAILSFRRNRPLFFGITFFFATFAPTSNLLLLIGSIMAERFLYIPSIGLAACAACAFALVWRRMGTSALGRYAVGAACGIILIACAARTYARNADWLDVRRFWGSALAAAPGSYRVHQGAATGVPLLTEADWRRSVEEAGRALSILDPLPDEWNAGNAYRQAGTVYRVYGDRLAMGSAGAGEEWYRKSLTALLRSERIELAQDPEIQRENARRGKPGLTFVPGVLYLELGRVYMRLSDPRAAVAAFEKGLRLESNPDLLEEAGEAYRLSGDLRKAVQALVEALAMDSKRVQLTSKLVDLYGQIDPSGCAVSRQGGSPTLNVECPMVHADICSASRDVIRSYLRKGQEFEAASIRRTAIQELGCSPELVN
jgi:protein O-mannosyl-transferase